MCSTLSPTRSYRFLFFFFFNDTATTEIYTLSLHDALPIWMTLPGHGVVREMLQLPDDVAPLAPLHEAMLVTDALDVIGFLTPVIVLVHDHRFMKGRKGRHVIGELQHFSNYAVAW